MTGVEEISARNEALLEWYRDAKRDLPWRDVDDPYLTLVSETMLQQTQVTRVIERFERFIEQFPDPESLASASVADLLAEWSGLGYNSRALRLRDAAAIVARDGWPTTADGLRSLPGVGPYTAAAIASIAFGEPVAAVDTNLRRVLGRWMGESLAGQALEERAALALGDPAGDWNQALMDLGSSICRPREPRCADCPVVAWCLDPSVYEAPPPQPAFNGSRRELRGAIVKASTASGSPWDAGRALGREDAEIASVIEDLREEGLLSGDG
ncbi:MAG TPA: A/G-specific adenine glycosylase [Acidimicrobiia bacterium]|nr:A/G-specific adenine glycosylase [Acidimicrobiia bacterium]